LGQIVKPFRDMDASDLASCSMQDAMNAQGYLLVRGVLPAEDVAGLLDEILAIVSEAGWLLPGRSPAERIADVSKACGESDEAFKSVYKRIFSLESFHAFAHHPRLREVLSLLVGPRLLIQPKLVARLIFPNCERLLVDAHQDHQSMAGDPESFTVWFPLHDCPRELGPLQILEGSHRFGLQKSDPKTGYVVRETALGGDWVSGAIHAGDVLIFHSLTVHASSPNVSNQMRVSMDYRFQDYGRVLNPALLVFPGGSANGRSWEATYAGWRSDELKYYWKRFPLRFSPSKAELAELAKTAERPEMRARYGRILSQIEEQMPD
jgi:ectoine hydroxylase-related dioxygenase (phytanoyl-CoA dioxygenase family)